MSCVVGVFLQIFPQTNTQQTMGNFYDIRKTNARSKNRKKGLNAGFLFWIYERGFNVLFLSVLNDISTNFSDGLNNIFVNVLRDENCVKTTNDKYTFN